MKSYDEVEVHEEKPDTRLYPKANAEKERKIAYGAGLKSHFQAKRLEAIEAKKIKTQIKESEEI